MVTWVVICLSLMGVGILDIKKNRIKFDNVILVAGTLILLIGLFLFFSKAYL